MPRDEREYHALPKTFSATTLTLLVVDILSTAAIGNECFNLAFQNFSNYDFSPEGVLRAGALRGFLSDAVLHG